MKKKIFAVSDIHGHRSLFEKALSESGFENNNPEHLLLVLGDCFDRGYENLGVYEYLSSIPNKVLIKGNHEEILEAALNRGYITYTDQRNGTGNTLSELSGAEITAEVPFRIDEGRERVIREFLDSFVEYFETENYIFTHGWIPVLNYGESYAISTEFRKSRKRDWHSARWNEWYVMYRNRLTLPDKTIVCGHRAALYGCHFDSRRSQDDYSPFFADKMIVIDSSTVISETVNVLVIEDEMLPKKTHSMKLLREHFDGIASGEKTVEMRLYDEKRREISLGDHIVFKNEYDNDECIEVSVEGVYRYADFNELTADFDPSSLGFSGREPSMIAHYMTHNIYGEDATSKYGAVAIRVKKIS